MDAPSVNDAAEPSKSALARRLLVELGASLDRVADQQRTITEQQSQLSDVKRRWQEEWGVALAELAKRELDLLERAEFYSMREQAVESAEQCLQSRALQLWRRARLLDCRETQVTQREATITTERSRHIARFRMQGVSLRARAGALARLQAHWESERRVEVERQRTLQREC